MEVIVLLKVEVDSEHFGGTDDDLKAKVRAMIAKMAGTATDQCDHIRLVASSLGREDESTKKIKILESNKVKFKPDKKNRDTFGLTR